MSAMEILSGDIDISELIEQYENLFVPAFAIKIGASPKASADQDLITQKPPVAVFSVSVDRALDEAGSFTFTVENPPYIGNKSDKFPRIGADSLFQPERNVIIQMGYAGHLKTIISGAIESVDVSFAGNGQSQLTIKGFDHLKKLMKDKKAPHTWGKPDDKITYSEIVKKLIGKYELSTDIEDTNEKYSSVKNDQRDDFEFIKTKLAKEVGYEVYVRDKVFHFHRPRMNDSVCIGGMEWGKSLISFTPSLDTSAQVTSVEVKGWDPDNQSAIIHTASAGSESNRGSGMSGSETAEAAGSTAVEQIWREELDTMGKVEQYAKAVLERRSQQLFTGSGECLGIPEIEPGRRIELLGLGKRFSKKYYITKVNQSISSSGFKTQFTVTENTLP